MQATAITTRLAESLYTEVLLLADETRAYLDGHGAAERELLPPRTRVVFACESLNATTRLMQANAALLARRAGPYAATIPSGAVPADPEALAVLPAEARRLFAAGLELSERVRRLDEGGAAERPASPARALLQRLERSL